MEMSTQYAKAKAKSKTENQKPRICCCGDCQGLPVVNGMCVFYYTVSDPYMRGAVTTVLRNHPIYHKLLNYARLCTHYDPPKNSDEWKVIFGCAQLLERVKLLPEGVALSDKKLFKEFLDGMHRRKVGGVRFDATWIGMSLEEFLLAKVHEEARRVLMSSLDRESLLSSVDKEELEKRTKFHKEDFVEFSKLPMFNTKEVA